MSDRSEEWASLDEVERKSDKSDDRIDSGISQAIDDQFISDFVRPVARSESKLEDNENTNDFLRDTVERTRKYRTLIEETSEFDQDHKTRLKFLAASCFIDDAWSRKHVNFGMLKNPHALRARSLQSMRYFRITLLIVILVHMSLVFWEPASSECDPDNTFEQRRGLLILIEIICLLFYMLVFFLYGLVNGVASLPLIWSTPSPVFNQSIQFKKSKSSQYWPILHAIVMLLIALDIFFRIVVFSSSSKNSWNFSRPLRSILLILNFRALRQMFGTIIKMLPNITLLYLGLCLINLLYSIIGFNLFKDLYPSDTPENFDTMSNALLSMFILMTTENFPSIMWPGFETYPVFTLVFFISFLCFGGIILATILGVIFDTYRTWVLKHSFFSFRKERTALSAAFTMICSDADTLSFNDWKRVFLLFARHGSSSYVFQVFYRNLGALKFPKKTLSISESDAIPQDLDEEVDRILLAVFRKITQDDFVDLRGFFVLCDRIRSKLELHEDYEILHAKEKWKNLLACLLELDVSEPVAHKVTLWDRLKGSKNEEASEIELEEMNDEENAPEEEKDNPFNNTLMKSSFVETGRDYPKFSILCWHKHSPEIRAFLHEYSLLSLDQRHRIRRIVRFQLLSSKNLLVNKFASDLISVSFSERVVESYQFNYFSHALIFLFSVLQLLSTDVDSSSVDILIAIIVFIFVLEMSIRVYAQGYSLFVNLISLMEFLVVSVSFVATLWLLFDDKYTVNSALTLNWERRSLKMLISLPILRLVVSFIRVSKSTFEGEILESKPLNVAEKRLSASFVVQDEKITRVSSPIDYVDPEEQTHESHERMLALRNLFYNLLRVLLILSVLVFAVSYSFAVVGMELFSCLETDPSLGNYTNFDDISGTALVLLQIVSSNDWNDIVYSVVTRSSLWSALYFVSYYAVVILVILNLFAALVVEAFGKIRDKHATLEKQNILNEKTTFGLYTRYVS